jgi:predicted Zn-dependent protease
MSAVYAQVFTRRYLTVVGGEVVYAGEERLNGMSIGWEVGRHDLWIDSLDEATVRAALHGLTREFDVPRTVFDLMAQAQARPAAVESARRAAAALGAPEHVRFEFELLHRRGVVLSPDVPDGVWLDHGGVRCRVMVESPRGTDRGRSYTHARSHDVTDLDLAGAVADAELEAAAITSGERLPSVEKAPVLLSPQATAALLHETCGHTLEADIPADSAACFAGRGGEQLAVESLTVLDEPARTEMWGGYEFDDEGRPAEIVTLMDAGRVGESLRDESTKGEGRSNSHGRRCSHQYPSVPRMSNLVVVPGAASMSSLLAAAEGGYYVHSVERAQLVPRQGVVLLHARLAHRIHNGEHAGPIAGLVIKGQVHDLLAAVSLIGAERGEFSGYCGKSSQRIPFGALTPRILLSEVAVIPY